MMVMYDRAINKYGVFILSLAGMVINLGAIVHLVKQEWVELWFPLSRTVPLLRENVLSMVWFGFMGSLPNAKYDTAERMTQISILHFVSLRQ